MRQALQPHPDTPCAAAITLTAEAVRTDEGLAVRYRLAGPLDRLALPAATAPVRTHGLWEHTCFEAFIDVGGEAYLEFNLAPSGAWAAYSFDAYRSGMAPLETTPPRIAVTRTAAALDVQATLALPAAGPIRVGLAAVIETADGRLSYWALAHPAETPDFHMAAGRVLAL